MFDRFWPVRVSVPTGDPSVLMLSVGDGIHVTINRSESAHWIEMPAPRLDFALSIGDEIARLPPMTGYVLISV